MKRLFWRWVFLTVALVLAARVTNMVVPGFTIDEIKDFQSGLMLMVGAGALALINATLGKILKFLTLPITCLTLGLFSLAINAGMLWLAGSLELGFRVDGFVPALVGSVVLSVINAVLGLLIPDEDKKE